MHKRKIPMQKLWLKTGGGGAYRRDSTVLNVSYQYYNLQAVWLHMEFVAMDFHAYGLSR